MPSDDRFERDQLVDLPSADGGLHVADVLVGADVLPPDVLPRSSTDIPSAVTNRIVAPGNGGLGLRRPTLQSSASCRVKCKSMVALSLVVGASCGSAPLNCTASSLSCASQSELQEACEYGLFCDWGEHAVGCTSRMTGCMCPEPYSGVATSVLPLLIKQPLDGIIIGLGPLLLWFLAVAVSAARAAGLRPQWTVAAFPVQLRMSTAAGGIWAALCVAILATLVALAALLPADVWGSCSSRGVCVYHQMFCEATHHTQPVRHPANFWSNVPYVFVSLGLLTLIANERLRGISRPFQMLDLSFALALMGMALASFTWHGSNCTFVHFVDIGLMNCVIAFFPYRFIFSACASAAGISDRAASGAAAAGYLAISVALFADMFRKTELYHESFPTGRLRSVKTLTPIETMMYIGAPGLYPLPTLGLMAIRRSWGYLPSMYTCLVFLPLAFVCHAAERLVVDFRCDPTSLLTQPTACFHVASGVAIAAAYVQARALEAGKLREDSGKLAAGPS